MIRLFKGLLIPGCVLGLWQWLVMIQYVKSESLSYPSAIAVAAIGVIQDGTLLVAAAQTFSGAFSGWLVGASLGIVVGIAFGLSQTLSRLMKITVETVRPIPSVALIPLALLIYGYGVLLETSVVAFSCFWPLLIVTESAVRGIEPRLIEVSRMLNFNLFDRVIKIILPAALPRIFVGMRLAAAVALVVSVTVEITANPMGLGYALIVAQESMRADRMFAFIGWIGLIGWSLNTALLNIQYRWFGKMGFWEEQV